MQGQGGGGHGGASVRQGLPAPSVAPVQRMEGRFPDPHPLVEGLHFVWLACMLLVAWRVSAASPLYVDVDVPVQSACV